MKNRIVLSLCIALMSVSLLTAQTLNVDVVKSKLEWKGTKKVGEHFGVIAIKSGTIEMKGGEIVGGTVLIDMNKISVLDTEDEDDQKRIIKDVSSKQFFNVKDFPTAKIEIKSVNGGVLKGLLTIKGNTKDVSFKVSQKMVGERLIASAVTFSIDRQDWKLKFSNLLKENVLDDPLQFTVHLEAK